MRGKNNKMEAEMIICKVCELLLRKLIEAAAAKDRRRSQVNWSLLVSHQRHTCKGGKR